MKDDKRVVAKVLIKVVVKAGEKVGPLVGEMAVMTGEKMVIAKGRQKVVQKASGTAETLAAH